MISNEILLFFFFVAVQYEGEKVFFFDMSGAQNGRKLSCQYNGMQCNVAYFSVSVFMFNLVCINGHTYLYLWTFGMSMEQSIVYSQEFCHCWPVWKVFPFDEEKYSI